MTLPSARTMAEARRMCVAGWTIRETAAQLGVSESAVRCWVDPEYAAKQRRWTLLNKVRRTARRPLGDRRSSVEFMEERARALYELAGLTPGMVARVMRFDYGVDWSEDRVRHLVGARLGKRRRELSA